MPRSSALAVALIAAGSLMACSDDAGPRDGTDGAAVAACRSSLADLVASGAEPARLATTGRAEGTPDHVCNVKRDAAAEDGVVVIDIDGSADARPSPSDPPVAALSSWVDAADDLCATGSQLYPSVRLGHRADVDTVSYGLTSHARSLADIVLPTDDPGRALAVALVEQAAAVATRWEALAVAQESTVAERSAAAREASVALTALVSAGAEQCAELAPERS